MPNDDRGDQLSLLEKLKKEYDYLIGEGDWAFLRQDFHRAIIAYDRALGTAREIKDYKLISAIMVSLANTYVKIGKYNEATNYYSEATSELKSKGQAIEQSGLYKRPHIEWSQRNFEGRRTRENPERYIYGYSFEENRALEPDHPTSEKPIVRTTTKRVSVILAFGFSVILLMVGLIISWITKNPSTLLALQIPVILFVLMENRIFFSNRRSF